MTQPPIAVIPAAGFGTRLGLAEGSKELVPVGTERRPVIDHLLERLSAAGLKRALIVTRAEKTDLRQRLRSRRHDLSLDYLTVNPTPSSVHTIAAALKTRTQANWLLGFPDILFDPHDACTDLLRQAQVLKADITLALVPSNRPDKADMAEVDDRGQVVHLRIKERDVGLRYTWIMACWSERFTQLLLQLTERERTPEAPELYVGTAVNLAIERGLKVSSIAFDRGWALDVGTPGDLERARRLKR